MRITNVEIKVVEHALERSFALPGRPCPRSTTASTSPSSTRRRITGIAPGRARAMGRGPALPPGQDPFAIEQHVQNLRSFAFFVGRPWPLEVALWDIIGKATGQPISRLLACPAAREGLR